MRTNLNIKLKKYDNFMEQFDTLLNFLFLILRNRTQKIYIPHAKYLSQHIYNTHPQ